MDAAQQIAAYLETKKPMRARDGKVLEPIAMPDSMQTGVWLLSLSCSHVVARVLDAGWGDKYHRCEWCYLGALNLQVTFEVKRRAA